MPASELTCFVEITHDFPGLSALRGHSYPSWAGSGKVTHYVSVCVCAGVCMCECASGVLII